jgi:hypothetical protein
VIEGAGRRATSLRQENLIGWTGGDQVFLRWGRSNRRATSPRQENLIERTGGDVIA